MTGLGFITETGLMRSIGAADVEQGGAESRIRLSEEQPGKTASDDTDIGCLVTVQYRVQLCLRRIAGIPGALGTKPGLRCEGHLLRRVRWFGFSDGGLSDATRPDSGRTATAARRAV